MHETGPSAIGAIAGPLTVTPIYQYTVSWMYQAAQLVICSAVVSRASRAHDPLVLPNNDPMRIRHKMSHSININPFRFSWMQLFALLFSPYLFFSPSNLWITIELRPCRKIATFPATCLATLTRAYCIASCSWGGVKRSQLGSQLAWTCSCRPNL